MNFKKFRGYFNLSKKRRSKKINKVSMKLSIKVKLITALSLLLLVFISFGVYSISQMSKLYEQSNYLSQLSVKKLNNVNKISNYVVSLRSKESELIVESFVEEKRRLNNEIIKVFYEFENTIS